MDIKYLNTFMTIVDSGSFQKAAERLNYSQSTVTFQIQQLEKELSLKLFEKIGRRMVVTDTGKEIMPYINNILENMNIIEHFGNDNLTGKLKVAMPESVLTYKSQEALKLFREKAPDVKLSLMTGNCNVIRDSILNGNIDFGVHYDIGGYSTNVRIEKIYEYEITLICSPQFTNRDFITEHQRKNICIITDDKRSIFFTRFIEYLKEKDIVIDNILELGSIEAIKRSVASNVGVAVLPSFTMEEELKTKVLEKINTDMKSKRISLILGYHKNKWISRSMELFISLLRKSVENKAEKTLQEEVLFLDE